ncbi:MAG: carboxypeptidase-like regulatory domain-containing protein, partial [Acidobacteriota bacterium]
MKRILREDCCLRFHVLLLLIKDHVCRSATYRQLRKRLNGVCPALARVATFSPLAGMLLLFFATMVYPVEMQQASISGVVIARENSKPLSGVAVELFDAAGTKISETTCNENGSFIFPPCAEGRYKVQITLSGFQDYSEEILISPGAQSKLTISLQLKALNETVEVVDRSAQIVPQTAAPLETL